MQEFMIFPTGAATFSEAMRMGSETYHHLKKVIKAKYGQDACNVGDEGGYAPPFQDNEEALVLIVEAIEKAGYTGKIDICMDSAASEFFKDGKYDLDFKNPESKPEDHIDAQALTDIYKGTYFLLSLCFCWSLLLSTRYSLLLSSWCRTTHNTCWLGGLTVLIITFSLSSSFHRSAFPAADYSLPPPRTQASLLSTQSSPSKMVTPRTTGMALPPWWPRPTCRSSATTSQSPTRSG
jgi:hypothetical protein